MDFYKRALEINREGWFIVNCFQIADQWRVNLQLRTQRGSSTEYFSEYADADDPLEALEAAFKNANARHPKSRVTAPTPKGKPRDPDTLTPEQERRLAKHLGDWFTAMKTNAWTRSRS